MSPAGRDDETGTTDPDSKPSSDSPGSSSRYLSPSAERALTVTVESSGSGSTSGSSASASSAWSSPVSGSVSGVIDVIWPMRTPPIRTSLPRTSFSAFGTSTAML